MISLGYRGHLGCCVSCQTQGTCLNQERCAQSHPRGVNDATFEWLEPGDREARRVRIAQTINHYASRAFGPIEQAQLSYSRGFRDLAEGIPLGPVSRSTRNWAAYLDGLGDALEQMERP